jgi:glyoxylase-like metal-dependent hydrolase (beta-lactamase superfamily II)
MKKLKKLMLWAAMAALALPVAADNPETAVERSQARAKQVLDAAVEAAGGRDAINNVKNVRIKISGEFIPRFQTATAEPPHAPGWFEEETVMDLEKNRTVVTAKNKGAGFKGKQRVVLNGKDSFTFDLLNKTVTPIDAPALQQPQFVQYQRRLPSLILRTALGRDATLRYLGEEVVNGSKNDVITFVHQDGFQMALYIDGKSHLISKYELIYPDALTGDEASEIMYEGYKKVGGIMVPSKWVWKQAGEVIANYNYDVAFDQQLADSLFDVKPDGFTAQPANAAAQRAVGVEKIGDGVYLVNNLGGGAYNVMAVEFADYIVAVEAPLNTQVSEQAIAEIKKAIPNKPIKYVAITHHHNDHSGGLRAFMAVAEVIWSDVEDLAPTPAHRPAAVTPQSEPAQPAAARSAQVAVTGGRVGQPAARPAAPAAQAAPPRAPEKPAAPAPAPAPAPAASDKPAEGDKGIGSWFRRQ